MEASLLDTAGTVVAIVLTLFVFSYLLGDNALYRLAEHLFIGAAVGYAAVVAFHNVIAPKLINPLTAALADADWDRVLLLGIMLALGLFLLAKPVRRLSWLGNVSVALLLGVGAALAIGGALQGTLLPQINAASDVMRYEDRYGPGLALFSGLVVLTGAIGVLLHFYFGAGREGRLVGLRNTIVQVWGGAGRWFILITFAAIFAATFMSRLSVLVGRVQFLIDGVRSLFGG